MRERKTIADYRDLATKRGFELLDTEVYGVHTKVNWRCGNGHTWAACYSDMNSDRATGCPHCSNRVPKTLNDYIQVAIDYELEFIGPIPANTHEKTHWRCSHGHDWYASYHKIKGGRRCTICMNRQPREMQHYRDLALKHDLEFLGKSVPENIKTDTTWKCIKGHVFTRTYYQVQSEYGCPICSQRHTGYAHDYAELGRQMGLIWIGPIPTANLEQTGWQCAKGHTFYKRRWYIEKGIGCPFCGDFVNGALVSRPQRELHAMLGGELNRPVKRYKIDIALTIDGINIACEYDCQVWHDTEHDTERDKYLTSQGWRVLRVKANVLLPTREQLDTAIQCLIDGDTYTEIVLDWKEG